jgi:hypothetical protein
MAWSNARPGRVVEFGEDPLAPGRGLLTELWTRLQGARTHPYGVEKSDPSITFNGVGPALQNYAGLGQLSAGAYPYRNGGSATIASGLVEGPLGDPARRIFSQRLARRSPMGGA